MIGVWMGDSFAEIFATSGKHQIASRWFHPKKSLADHLRELVPTLEATSGRVVVATSRAEMAVARKQGSEPALLTTAGFETWARFGENNSGGVPSLKTEREWFPTSPEKIFGVDERILSDGRVSKLFDETEIEALLPKFQTMKVKEIAVAFLHGDRFPANEKAAADFLRTKGFNVTCSHEVGQGMNDLARIRRTVESAFAEPIVQDDLSSLKEALPEGWTLEFWSPSGVSSVASAARVRGGVEAALAAKFAKQLTYFFGLEEFLVFSDGFSELFPVQPTGQIGAAAWPFPSWTSVDRGYEPGPMLFGKSHQLTILDVLFVRDRLSGDIEGFSERVQAKSSARILEALFTFGKNLADPGRRAADAKDIAADLEAAFVERIAMDVLIRGTIAARIGGPLASSIVPLLEKRMPTVRFTIDTTTIAEAAAGGRT